MKRNNSAWLVCACLILSGMPVLAQDGTSIKPEGGNFTALFPAPAKELVASVISGPWALENHTFNTGVKDGKEYAVIWCDYPRDIVMASPPERIYQGIINGYTTDGKKVLQDKAIKISGHAGRELEVDVGQGRIHRVRFAMAGSRLYQAMTYAPAAGKDAPELGKFLDSFSIVSSFDAAARGFRLEAVELPGWVESPRDKAKTAATWVKLDWAARSASAMITVEVIVGKEGTAEEAAASLAKTWGGQVVPQRVMLDGVPAIKIEAANATKEMRPVQAFMAARGGHLYLIMGGVMAGQSVAAEMEAIAKGWKWVEMVPASERLKPMPQPVMALNRRILVNYPRDMHVNPTPTPETVLDLSLQDTRRNTGLFHAYIQIAPLNPQVGFERTKEVFAQQMNAQKMTDQPMALNPPKNDPLRVVSELLSSEKAREIAKSNDKGWVKWALFKLDEENMVLINFTVVPADEQEKARYAAAVDAIVDSIRPVAGGPPK